MKLSSKFDASWKCDVEHDDGKVTFRGIKPTCWHIVEQVGAQTPSDRLKAMMTIVTAWEGVEDEEGRAVPFTQENLAALLSEYPAVLFKLNNYLMRSFFLVGTRDRGNLLTPSESGPLDGGNVQTMTAVASGSSSE